MLAHGHVFLDFAENYFSLGLLIVVCGLVVLNVQRVPYRVVNAEKLCAE